MGLDVRPPQVAGARWHLLLGALTADAAVLADRTVARLGQLPSYRQLDPDDVRPGVLALQRAVLGELVAGRDPAAGGAPHAATFAGLGAVRARQGVTAGDLVHGLRAGRQELLRRAREVTDVATDGELRHTFVEFVLAWYDFALVACADGHRAADVGQALVDQHRRTDLVRAAVCGELTAGELVRRAAPVSLDPSLAYHVLRARPATPGEAAETERLFLAAATGPCGGRTGLVAPLGVELVGVVPALPTQPARVPVGAGGPVHLDALPGAHDAAGRALEAALILRRPGVTDLDTLGAEAAVATDHAVGDVLLARYVTPLVALGQAGELVLDTVDRYLANDGRLDTTARELHVHANTVRYRLGRFEHVTGSSLRSTDALVSTWWALRRRALARPR